jgi:hypothetical protein
MHYKDKRPLEREELNTMQVSELVSPVLKQDLFKVDFTTRDPEERARELSSLTEAFRHNIL